MLRGGPKPSPDLPDWQGILQHDPSRWAAARAAADGPRVLIATATGDHVPGVTVESALAVALTLRGARVSILLCDGCLPGCLVSQIRRFRDVEQFVVDGPQKKLCAGCMTNGWHGFEPLGLPILSLGDFVSRRELEWAQQEAAGVPLGEIDRHEWEGVAVGEHGLAGALRFLTRGDLGGEPLGEEVARRYLEGSLVTARAMDRLFEEHAFDVACFHHGIYVPHGVIADVARRREARVVTWSVGYRRGCFIFSDGDTYHRTMMDEPASTWEDMPWTPEMESEISAYLESRAHGTRDWITYNTEPVEELEALGTQIGTDLSQPTVALLTNVIWDAQLHYQGNAFPNMLAWVLETIRYFAARPELQLVIRVHPGEVRGTLPSRQLVIPEIMEAFPELPSNVHLVPPESRVSTYALIEQCDAALIYGTKVGVEVSSVGVPVIVAGEAWIRGKGITYDADSPEEYRRLLELLPFGERMDEDRTCRALKYAYHFFLRRMIPWGFMEPGSGGSPFKLGISSVAELEPGRDPGLDLVCEGILEGRDFVYPAEQLHVPVGTAASAP